MKILLISLPDPAGIHVFRFHSAGFGSSFVMPNPKHRYDVYPPIYEGYVAPILEGQGHEVRILDCQSPNLPVEEIFGEIGRQKPSLIVSRICLPSYYDDLKIMGRIKEAFSSIFLVGWGGICKVFPEQVLKESRLDAVFRVVELEMILPEFVSAYEQDGIDGVAGVSCRKNGQIIHASDRPFNKNLDALPIPAYHLLDMKKYVAQESRYVKGGSKDRFVPFFSVSGSRGCSFNCLYCPYPVTYGPWRGRSPEKIVDEIEVLVKQYDVHVIWFHDQTFSMIPKRTMSLCDEIINRGLDIHWATETRVDRLTPEIIKKMKASGCGRLEVGVETGDEALLKNVGKRGLTPERVEKTIDAIKREGIIAETNFLVGLPGETWDKTRKTAELIRRIRPDVVTAMIVTPYPGTPLYKMVVENGWLLTKDWSKYTLFEPVFSMPEFSAKDMKEAHAYLYLQYGVYRERLETMEALRRGDFVTLVKKAARAPRLLLHIPEMLRNRSKKGERE
jgi:anaerobic magnesium-protoporphyrin IX monomethyl ester cyclase